MFGRCGEVCRACLTTNEYFTYKLGKNVSTDLYLYCTTIEVRRDDLPKTLCDSCYENLTKYSEFKRNCINSQYALTNINESRLDDATNTSVVDALDYHKTISLFNSVNVKTENVTDGIEHILKIKSEDITDHFENDLYEPLNINENNYSTNKNEMKKRKIRKLDKRKLHQKTKLKITRKHLSFTCKICNKKFNYLERFEAHKLEHEGKEAHIETHKENRDRPFTCEHCGKKFYTNTILLSHVSRRHTNRRFICQTCNYPFTDKYNLAKHLLIHDGKKLFTCEICNKSYTTRSSLVEHRRIHSGERPYICNYCPKSFISKRRRDDHHKIHTGERPHKCVICEQGFTQRGTLKRHMKVHNRTMPILN
ncbi:unnamed protein product [Diatraea saccharalis]|uniref:Uncharacterized protein n=1 Tax=Diatraea saccharalis TaxID=40085 RepID=A0A9N9RHM9_9NEOP|nr:unnamed protein product [Diatraea saccharalis]